MKNRFMLAPLTNSQSNDDGKLSEAEFHWLTLRAKGQFGLTMTCASHVQENGRGFPGQLGIFDDKHLDGHTRLAKEIKRHGSLAVVQLHHAGMRSPSELIKGFPLSPSGDVSSGSTALSHREVQAVRDDFITAAIRAKLAGYDGIELHGAHGYMICQFLSSETNNREDSYGGSLENRARILFEIVEGIRINCGKTFLIGVRLSPERFGMLVGETKKICERLASTGLVDFLDISLWDSFKKPDLAEYQDKSLLTHFTDIDLKETLLTVAGKIFTGDDVSKVLNAGADFVTIGRAAILHHDFPKLVLNNPSFTSIKPPVTRDYLAEQGLGDEFIDYMHRRGDFVKD